MRYLPMLTLIAFLGLLATLLAVKPAPKQGDARDMLPALSLTSPDTHRHWQQNTLQGRVTLLNFFASWCAPCQAEMPELNALHEQFPDLHFSGIAWNDDPKTLRTWLKKQQNPFDEWWFDERGESTIALGIKGIPETLIVDRHGMVRYRLSAPLTQPIRERILAPLITRLLAEDDDAS